MIKLIICPICNKKIKYPKHNQKFCNWRCTYKFHKFKTIKDVRYLILEDRILFDKLKNEGVI